MRIALILSGAPAYSETFFNNLIAGLQKKNIDVIVFSRSKPPKNAFYKHVRVRSFSRSNPVKQLTSCVIVFWDILFALKRAIRLYKLERESGSKAYEAIRSVYLNVRILRYNFDWLHFGFATVAIGSELVAKAMGAKMAVSIRGYDVCIYPLKHKGCYSKLWQYVDKVHSISDDLTHVVKGLGLKEDTPVIKITPAIDVAHFRYKVHAGKFHDPVRIISVGRLHWKKGFETAIDAMRELSNRGRPFVYDIIGEGNEKDRLILNIHRSDLGSNIRLLGKLPHKEVNQVLKNYDIYIQPSNQEGFCNAVLEAQATGLYCIVSNAEGLPENVDNGSSGVIFPKRNRKALAESILEVINIPVEEKEKHLSRARMRIEKEFNLEKHIDQFLKFYMD